MANLTNKSVAGAFKRLVAANKNVSVALRRFATNPLTGDDLSEIRTSVLGMTQTELAEMWGMSRTQVSRLELRETPDQKTCDAYLGLMIRSLVVDNGGAHGA